MLSLAVAVGCATWLSRHHPHLVVVLAATIGSTAAIVVRWRTVALAIALTVVAASVMTARAWQAYAPAPARPVSGWVTVVTDPQRIGSMVIVVVQVGTLREQVRAFGSIGRHLELRRVGDQVWVSGRQRSLSPTQLDRLAPKHVRATLQVDVVADWMTGSPLAVAANRIRQVLTNGSSMMSPSEQALFLGLIIGDDHAEPPTMVEDFRSAGLSHLTAVSGQNVAFLLIAFGPLLRRLRPHARWAATVGLVLWFAVLTRFEPSVLRAAGMAMLAATAFWRGWTATPRRLLALTVVALLLIDPLLTWSVGWWLSVGATMGLALLATPLADRLPGPRWIAVPIAVTLAAQTGIAPISVFIFGRAPLVSVLTNVLAVPIAGFVMVWGIPAGLLAGIVAPVASIVQLPSRIGTRWVLLIARLGARIEPAWTGRWGALLQLAVVAAIMLRKPDHHRNASAPGSPGGDRDLQRRLVDAHLGV